MKKRVICLMLGLSLMISQNMTVFATTENTAGQPEVQNEQVGSQLNTAKERIDELSVRQAEVQAQICETDADLVDLMILISATETDIANTETSIAEMQTQIDQTASELAVAESDMNSQYDDMKKRIRYLYEKDWNYVWFEVLLNSTNLTTFLNRADYAKKVHDYDRQTLMDFAAKVSEVTAMKNEQETMKAELNAQKELLETQKSDLEARKVELQARLDEMRMTSHDYVQQITTVRAQAAEIIALIGMQEEELANLIGQEAVDEAWWDISGSGNYIPGSSSGPAIVAFAEQFVGNPYVWGGNSLTNGIDCSHFVYQVLKNCGVYDGGYVTSAGWRTKGEPVASLAEAKAGDIICYSGHVAIYDGYGGIVEAKGSKWGITHDRSAAHATILAIRRFTQG